MEVLHCCFFSFYKHFIIVSQLQEKPISPPIIDLCTKRMHKSQGQGFYTSIATANSSHVVLVQE